MSHTLIEGFSTRSTEAVLQAFSYAVLGAVAVYFIRERIPVTKRALAQSNSPARRSVPYATFLKRSSFWAFGATITITSLGAFLPSIYLPTYAKDLGYSNNVGTVLIVVMNRGLVQRQA